MFETLFTLLQQSEPNSNVTTLLSTFLQPASTSNISDSTIINDNDNKGKNKLTFLKDSNNLFFLFSYI